jgi:hypothetical protein
VDKRGHETWEICVMDGGFIGKIMFFKFIDDLLEFDLVCTSKQEIYQQDECYS